VVNHNGQGYLSRTLGRLLELRDHFERILLVDDASSDASVALGRSYLAERDILALTENVGPGRARNAGLGELKADRILFLDNDVFLGADTVELLGAALDAAPSAVIALPRIVSDDGTDRIEYEGGEAHVSGLVALRNPGATRSLSPAGPPERITSMVTCSFLLDCSRWGNRPLFDPDFWMYLEDHELGLRANLSGKDVIAVPAAECLHGQGTPGLSIRVIGRHSTLRIRHTILNRWQLIAKLYQGRTLLLLSPYFVLFELSQFFGSVSLGWGGHWLWAARTFVARFPKIMRKRRSFRGERVRQDRDVLAAGPLPLNPALAQHRLLRPAIAVLDRFAEANWSVAASLLARSPRS